MVLTGFLRWDDRIGDSAGIAVGQGTAVCVSLMTDFILPRTALTGDGNDEGGPWDS